MKRKLFILITFCLIINICRAQKDTMYHYVAHATLGNNLKNHILVDAKTQTKFIIDSLQIFITAIDSGGKELWQIDPWKDNKLMEYRVKRPIIVQFSFANNKWTDNKEVIWIVYNNTQFGIIDKQTGKFTWFGQE